MLFASHVISFTYESLPRKRIMIQALVKTGWGQADSA
jgi:hypothetical protein